MALIKHGADVKAKDAKGMTAVENSSWQGHLDDLRVLLRKGADVNVADLWVNKSVFNFARTRTAGSA